ncbi:substrate-binding domain-containing protein [Cupriavidus basilensis]
MPESLHAPLRQRMVLLKSASPTTTEFYAFVKSPAARAIFRKYGFTLPGE